MDYRGIYPNNNNFQQQQQPQFFNKPSNPLSLKGRPVSSLEEVRAIPVDFDGSIFFFPDLANGKIYTKQVNIDGTASLNVYEYKQIENNNFSEFVTRDEFNQTLTELKDMLLKKEKEEEEKKQQTF